VTEAAPPTSGDPAAVARALAKASRRLIPFMFVLYVVAYLDRINVGFAALQMRQDLGLDEAVYGLGAGIFFVGYFLFELPSNLILARVGARLWIARIMVTWGLVSSAMMFVRGPASFYALRFLLGVAEAGFFPGMILYLTYWFPPLERARAVARFMTATAIAGVVGGPVSGALLGLDGVAGLRGWEWLFLLEGLPAVGLGLVVLVYLPDGPAGASWLTPAERRALAACLAAEEGARRHHATTLRGALLHGRVWLLGLLYFVLVNGVYGVSLWLPQIVKGLSGAPDLVVGIASALPYLFAALGMVAVGAHSDRTGERRWHVAGAAALGAAGLAVAACIEAPLVALGALSLAALGIWSALGPFWALPTAILRGTAAAAGIALVNSIGNLGGFAGPYLIGLVKEATGSFAGGLLVLAGGLVAAGALALGLRDEG
jgi:ACS family tartrate transporter-like MFS transporter